MGGLPEESETFFRLSPAQRAEALSFGVTRGNANLIQNAKILFSELYGELSKLKLCRYPLVQVGDCLSVIQDGLHGVRHYVPSGVPLLGVGNVTDVGVLLDEVNHITAEEHERLEASQVRCGDLLVTITGRLGTAARYDLDDPANLSAHVALCRAKPGFELLYLKEYFASRFGAASFSKAEVGSTHPHINVRRLAELPIPLPPLKTQTALVAAMNKARTARKAKLDEAEALLGGMDEFLLTSLKLFVPKPATQRHYALRLRDVTRERRLNADYFHPERLNALRAIEAAAGNAVCPMLSDLVSFERNQVKEPGENYLSLAHVKSHTGELCDANEDASGTCFLYEPENVLFARLRPYLNKVYCSEMAGCCSPEFHVLRLLPHSKLLPEYLAAILRSSLVLAQTRHMMTGNTHPRLANDDVVNLRIPVPPLPIQQQIAAEVRRRREAARRLRMEAEKEWQGAKMWFEAQLLGDSATTEKPAFV